MPAIEITQQYIIYTAQTRLLELATEIAQSRSLTKPAILEKRQKATKIRLWLKALNDDYASRDTREKIWYALMDLANLNDVPFAPVLTTNSPPSILVGIPGPPGTAGATGATGGGVAFSATGVGTDTVVDSFDTSLATSAEWTYEVFDSTNKRVEKLIGGWLSGTSTDDGGLATIDIGDTSSVTFGTNISGSTVQLIAYVTTGTWTIRGTRQLIPVTGNGITQPTALTNGKIWIGDSSNQPAEQTFIGDVVVTNTGTTSITPGVIIDSDINASAAINVGKIAPLIASKAVVSDSSGFLTTSVTAASKVDYLANVTSDIQTQIDTIAGAGTITGAITPYVTSDAVVSRAIVSNLAGKLTTALTTSTEIGYVSGVTSAVQTQIDGKVSKTGDTMSGALNSSSTGEFDSGIRTQSSGIYFKVKILDIGAWNMGTTGAASVAHGLTLSKIISISASVINDAGTSRRTGAGSNGTLLIGSGIDFIISPCTATDVQLGCDTGSFSSGWSSASNRGRIVIIYEA